MATVWSWAALCFMLYIESVVAYQFTVGGSKGWVLPSPSDKETYNQWAGRNRFQIGDTLLFKYDKTEDSVVQVRQESYDKCNTWGPIASYTDGNTVFKLPINGPFYFISGNESRCQLGEKIIVVVLVPCHMRKNCRPTSSPSPVSASPSHSPQLSPNARMLSSPHATLPSLPTPTLSPTPTVPSPSPSLASSALSPIPMASFPSPSPFHSPVPAPSPTPTGSSLSPSPFLISPALSPTPTTSLVSPALSPSPSQSGFISYTNRFVLVSLLGYVPYSPPPPMKGRV